MSKHKVIVVGSGIIGASFAYHLTKAGAEVKLMEAGLELGGLATAQSWAWINASRGNSRPYFDLRHFAMQEWRRCDRDVPGLNVQWCGSLLWDLPEDELRAFVHEHGSWGYDIRLLDSAEIRQREPNLAVAPAIAALASSEAAIEPAATALQFLRAAQHDGADVMPGARVKWLIERGGTITGVMTAEGRFEADTVILAVGTETNILLETVNRRLDLRAPPGLLMCTEPAPELLSGILLSPDLHVRQTPEGHLIAGSDQIDATSTGAPKDAAAQLMQSLQALVHGTENLAIERFTIGNRPMPADGFPCVGYLRDLPGLYIAVTHSGVTLAPALGALGTAEILTASRHALLTSYAPDRLLAA